MKQLTKKLTILGLVALFSIPLAANAQRRGTHTGNNNKTRTPDRRGQVQQKKSPVHKGHQQAYSFKSHHGKPHHKRPNYRPNHRPHYRPHYRPHHRPHYRPHYRPQYRSHYRPNPYRRGPAYHRPVVTRPFGMRVVVFDDLGYSMNRSAFDRDKLDMAKTAILHNGANTDQVIALMNRLSFDRNRLELAKFAYAYVVDPENYFRTANSLSFYSSRRELLAFIR